MTKEEARDYIREWCPYDRQEEIIEALEQEPCEDAISRQKLLKAIATLDKFGCNADTKLVPYKDHYVPYIRYYDVIDCIKYVPPVTPQPKAGHWVAIDDEPHEDYECDKCSFVVWAWTADMRLDEVYKYCPSCGAKME